MRCVNVISIAHACLIEAIKVGLQDLTDKQRGCLSENEAIKTQLDLG